MYEIHIYKYRLMLENVPSLNKTFLTKVIKKQRYLLRHCYQVAFSTIYRIIRVNLVYINDKF